MGRRGLSIGYGRGGEGGVGKGGEVVLARPHDHLYLCVYVGVGEWGVGLRVGGGCSCDVQ